MMGMYSSITGGSGVELAESITSTSDGGTIILGYSTSNDGDVSGNHGASDLIMVKLYPFDIKVKDYSKDFEEFYLNYDISKREVFATYNSTTSSIVVFDFFDITGRKIYSKKFQVNPGNNRITFPLNNNGVYFGNLMVNNHLFSKKLIVHN